MIAKILQLLTMSCRHRKTSQPFAPVAARSSSKSSWDPVPNGRHYVVCLDCGKEFDYDWTQMRIVS